MNGGEMTRFSDQVSVFWKHEVVSLLPEDKGPSNEKEESPWKG